MNSVIVYDSTYGHTEYVAQVICNVLVEYGSSCASPASAAPLELLEEADLLVLASPTERRRPTRQICSWLASLPSELASDLAAAAFDTRYRISRFKSGSAAIHLARGLKRKGTRLMLPATSFFVSLDKGALEEGEAERAREWAKTLAARMGAKRAPRT